MIYEKPEISFQKFHTDTFLDNTDLLSANSPNPGGEEFDPWGEFEMDSAGFNGTISINSDGVGGWFNG